MVLLSSIIQQLAGIGGVEWIFIIIVVVVLFFGVKKIPEIARSVGKASTEYEKARIQAKRELDRVTYQKNTDESITSIDRDKLESVAEILGIDCLNKNDDELRTAIDLKINNDKLKI